MQLGSSEKRKLTCPLRHKKAKKSNLSCYHLLDEWRFPGNSKNSFEKRCNILNDDFSDIRRSIPINDSDPKSNDSMVRLRSTLTRLIICIPELAIECSIYYNNLL